MRRDHHYLACQQRDRKSWVYAVFMNAPVTNAESIVGTPSAAEATYHLERVPDAELLTNTRRLVGRSNHVLAALLAHLAEVEARGIHRLRACSSLYAYCVYELRLSEDAAYRPPVRQGGDVANDETLSEDTLRTVGRYTLREAALAIATALSDAPVKLDHVLT